MAQVQQMGGTWWDEVLSEVMFLADIAPRLRVVLASFVLPLALLTGVVGYALAHVGSEATAQLVDFDSARGQSDFRAMRRAVDRMWVEGVIHKDMTVQETIAVLGVPDDATEHFDAVGFSIGYGASRPDEGNRNTFFWLHFKKGILVGWGEFRS